MDHDDDWDTSAHEENLETIRTGASPARKTRERQGSSEMLRRLSAGSLNELKADQPVLKIAAQCWQHTSK